VNVKFQGFASHTHFVETMLIEVTKQSRWVFKSQKKVQ